MKREFGVGRDGLDATLVVKHEGVVDEIRLGGIDGYKEFAKAQSWMSAILCSQFYDLRKMRAFEEGKELYELFDSEEELLATFAKYISSFVAGFAENACESGRSNWSLFERKRKAKDAKRGKRHSA